MAVSFKATSLMLRVFAFFALFLSGAVFANDHLAARHAAADRYFSVVPINRMLEDTYAEIAKQVPQDQRADFLAQMRSVVRVDMLERISRDAMIKTFTADELNALADFYGSPHGASAMRKFGPFMDKAMPPLMQEVQKAIRQVRH